MKNLWYLYLNNNRSLQLDFMSFASSSSSFPLYHFFLLLFLYIFFSFIFHLYHLLHAKNAPSFWGIAPSTRPSVNKLIILSEQKRFFFFLRNIFGDEYQMVFKQLLYNRTYENIYWNQSFALDWETLNPHLPQFSIMQSDIIFTAPLSLQNNICQH